MKKFDPIVVNVNGEEVTAYKIDNDTNGNPRYIVHFLELGVKLDDYKSIYLPRPNIYRGKDFGGGYVIQSYNIQEDIERYQNMIENYYNKTA